MNNYILIYIFSIVSIFSCICSIIYRYSNIGYKYTLLNQNDIDDDHILEKNKLYNPIKENNDENKQNYLTIKKIDDDYDMV